MPSVVTQATDTHEKSYFQVDIDKLEAPMKEALRRTAVFLGYAVHSSEIAPLKSVTLKSPIILDVGVPNEIPVSDRKGYQGEFTQWAIGQGLIEIDQSYQRFVASACSTLTDIELWQQGKPVPDQHKAELGNTWKVHQKFYEQCGQQSPEHNNEADYLRSLGNARNCLAHSSGTVASHQIVAGTTKLKVSWPGRDMLKVNQEGQQTVLPRDRNYKVLKADVGSSLTLIDVVREHSYAVGEVIRLSHTDLSEILFFYQILSMKIGVELRHIVQKNKAAEIHFKSSLLAK